ncbi:nucleotide exchange factor GrpE [Thermosipho atlanticus]|uniref:Protein GrpE n=1 Tax=Thermosipho atlanticus DSM 15807 TaxID=1123380 RepID=A0A1M5S3D9_9BACT|nr:nucleotide exchange factor GrpE [Thermosipho atlanticus]SHH32981.1 molecular chaperone GrpE [Thermosipho atlanticus DSM 15807]
MKKDLDSKKKTNEKNEVKVEKGQKVNNNEKKIKELKERIEELEKQLKDFENYARILKSQFENYKKDVAKEKEQITISTTGRIVEKFIPIIDDFKRAFVNAEEEIKNTKFFKGIELIYKNFMKVLKDLGLSELSVGEKFDPFEQEAVEKIMDEEKEEYTIIEVVEDGYKFRDRVIKPAKVKVTVKPRR